MTLSNIDMVRVATVVPRVYLADPKRNVAEILRHIDTLKEKCVDVALFPELSITGYSCGDLFRQQWLLSEALKSLDYLAQMSAKSEMAIVVGLPVLYNDRLYNCAAVCNGGSVVGLVPKTYLPDHNEFYEKRRFTSGLGVEAMINVPNQQGVLMKTDQIFEASLLTDKYETNLNVTLKIGIEICEDLWTPIPPSSKLCLAGANLILNPSASNELISKHDYLVDLLAQQSARCLCAYAYASAGKGESSTDVVYAGNGIIAENGKVLKESKRFAEMPIIEIADVDLGAISSDRQNSTFGDQAVQYDGKMTVSPICIGHIKDTDTIHRKVSRLPFVPADPARLTERCEEIISIQSAGLQQRLRFTNCKSLVIGISGGLDSTLALMVAVDAFDKLGLPRKGIYGITMPGFGTTSRTHTNASSLMEELGVTSLEILIGDAVQQHFHDIGHDESIHDVTYENCQARERTQILMDYANKISGMVLGTGDLSELALGWCTYNGDHMSMYAVNVSIPKTLVRHLVAWFASQTENEKLREALLDICDTPISPELTPADKDGNIAQKTEDLVGPYELHDFFIYYFLRYAFTPDKIYSLARAAFKDVYTDDVIKHWLKTFYRRFFNQQFKRSCMPDGPKVGSVSLSPRGDWRMPSDAYSTLWTEEVDKL